tara:strand:- start:75 stop:392 length:318 start_codon:yes stop_codon:yes gene_type:complete
MRLTQDIIRNLIKEALNAQERDDKINTILNQLANLDDADVNYIMSQVRNKMANEEAIGEKLDKDADAGDYVKDFQDSDAPQFKGKSKKKKQQMAIAAYLDAKDNK